MGQKYKVLIQRKGIANKELMGLHSLQVNEDI
jgi:hypothetical protein